MVSRSSRSVDCSQGTWNASLAFFRLAANSSQSDCRLKLARSSTVGVSRGSVPSSGSNSTCSLVTPHVIRCCCLRKWSCLCQSYNLAFSSRRISKTRAAWRCLMDTGEHSSMMFFVRVIVIFDAVLPTLHDVL